MKYLASWITASATTSTTGSSSIDGWAGATRSTNTTPPFNISWDLKTKAGAVIPDGTYTLNLVGACNNTNNERSATATFKIAGGVLTPGTSSNATYFNITSWTLQ